MILIKPIVETLKSLARRASSVDLSDIEKQSIAGDAEHNVQQLEVGFANTFGEDHGRTTRIRNVGHEIRRLMSNPPHPKDVSWRLGGIIGDLHSLENELNAPSNRNG